MCWLSLARSLSIAMTGREATAQSYIRRMRPAPDTLHGSIQSWLMPSQASYMSGGREWPRSADDSEDALGFVSGFRGRAHVQVRLHGVIIQVHDRVQECLPVLLGLRTDATAPP